MTHRIGQQLGNYRLTRLLGQGGFADVYLGEHLYLNTKAAIKVLQAHITNEDSSHFLNEARTIAALVHPHIVRVLDFGLEGYTPYLVMDYASHGTLRQYLPQGVPMSPQRILPYVKQIASALRYAHEHKIVHRDIKPENLLLGSHHEGLLSDFGIAIASQSSRSDGMGAIVGTVNYIAPEQIQGKPVTASDQYALGIVVYEWLSGDPPFHGTFTEVATQHMFVPPPPLRQKIPSLPPAIEHVVATALAKDPQQRFATIQVFAQAFESACQEDMPTSRSPVSSPENMAPDASTIIVQRVSTAPATLPTVFANTPLRLQQTSQRTESVPPLLQASLPSSIKQGISRRTFALGMAGMAVFVVAGSAIAWWEASQRSTSPQSVRSVLSRPSDQTTSTTRSTMHTVSQTPTAPQPTTNPPPSPTEQVSPGQSSGYALGTTIYTYRGHSTQVVADTWSPDGSRVATGSLDTTVQVWDATTGSHVLVYMDHRKKVWAVAWQPHGQQIASGGDDLLLRVWDATTGATNKIYAGHTQSIYSIAWSPDGARIASCGDDGTVRIWDASTGNTDLIYTQHTSAVLSVAWSHNGSHIVSGDYNAVARVWDASSGQTLGVYTGHTQRIWTVAWSPDDQSIASGGHDGTTQIWNPTTGEQIYVYQGQQVTVWQALWSPNGQLIASASYDGTAQIWQAV